MPRLEEVNKSSQHTACDTAKGRSFAPNPAAMMSRHLACEMPKAKAPHPDQAGQVAEGQRPVTSQPRASDQWKRRPGFQSTNQPKPQRGERNRPSPSPNSFVPTGLIPLCPPGTPAINRWAIFFRPTGRGSRATARAPSLPAGHRPATPATRAPTHPHSPTPNGAGQSPVHNQSQTYRSSIFALRLQHNTRSRS